MISNKVQGIINLHSSTLYPAVMEIIFINDDNGEKFKQAIDYWLNEKNMIVRYKDKLSDLTISVDILFKNQGLFLIFINNILSEFSFYDERPRKIINKENLIHEVKKLFIAVDT